MKWVRIAAWSEAGLLAGLTLTGLYLNWFYRPSSVRLYSFGDTGGQQTSVRVAHAVRALHVVASIGFIWIGAALAVMCVVGAIRQTRAPSRRVAAAATGFAVLALATSITGYLLPWDQIALYAVTIGSNFHGAWDAAFSDQVRFVIVNSTEIAQTTYRNWFVVHAFVLPIALTVILVTVSRHIGDSGLQEREGGVTES